MVRWAAWVSGALFGATTVVGCIVWRLAVTDQQLRERAFLLQRTGNELELAWLATDQRLARASRACRPNAPSWLCERVPCNDFPRERPDERIPRLLRAPTLVGDGPRLPERPPRIP